MDQRPALVPLSFVLAAPAAAQTLDFETLPDGTPTSDLQEISDQYAGPPFGVSFEVVDRTTGAFLGYPRIAKVGVPRTAFAGCPNNSGPDVPLQNAGVCDSFLTDDDAVGSIGSLKVIYTSPVARASAVLLDVDAYSGTIEEWTVTAFDAAGNVVDVVQPIAAAPCGRFPGNGTANAWSVESPTGAEEIATILLEFTGTALISIVGVAFDNFTPSEAGIGSPLASCTPEPNSTGEPSVLFATGSSILADNRLRVRAQGLPPNAIGYFLASTTLGNVPMAGGSQGTLCLGGAVGRLNAPGQAQNGGSCGLFDLTLDLAMMPQPTGFVSVLPGETWTFQCWHRDANPGLTSNFSNAVSVTFF
ncbi:MAG: hypothetical protein AAF957_22605 [Planctomycetota bacterium]